MTSISRRIVVSLALASIANAAPMRVLAQSPQRTFEESYRAITPQPTASGAKIEIIDFFWYGCPYCYQLVPLFVEWEKAKPADVIVRRIPAILRTEWVPDAHLYYTLETLGEADRLHLKAFDAIHRDRLLSTDTEAWARWAVANGIERARWDEAYNSRGVRDKVLRAVDLGREYDVRGTPVLVVDGRYQTGSGQAGSLKNVIPTLDELINLARENRKKQ